MTGFSALPLAEHGTSDAQWAGISKIMGPRWARLPILTIGLLGVQVFWSVEMSYGECPMATVQVWTERIKLMMPLCGPKASPYLISLGLSKSWMSLVFLAGPLAGLIVQPVVGKSTL